MKKSFLLPVALLLITLLSGCGNNKAEEGLLDTISKGSFTASGAASAVSQSAFSAVSENESAVQSAKGVDVDLTKLSSTMVYSEVYNMMNKPADYIGKTVKMKGSYTVYRDDKTGNVYYSCLIKDATACCSQGLEFTLANPSAYPADSQSGKDITVTGIFETYDEDGTMYCRLKSAVLA